MSNLDTHYPPFYDDEYIPSEKQNEDDEKN